MHDDTTRGDLAPQPALPPEVIDLAALVGSMGYLMRARAGGAIDVST